jgi:hypothetical protein
MPRGLRTFRSITAAAAATTVVLTIGVTPARAVTAETVAGVAKVAYEAYKRFGSGELTLSSATTQIINAVNQAKTEIIAHIDLMASSTVKGCTKSAVIDLADIKRMSRDTVEDFARDTTSCAATAETLIADAKDRAVVDQLGFLVNTVGPIALFARAYARFSTTSLRPVLASANERLLSRLAPSCRATPLFGDAEAGAPVEVILSCTAFNGTVGRDRTLVRGLRRGQPLPTFNFSKARTLAMRATSYPIAVAVLPGLR